MGQLTLKISASTRLTYESTKPLKQTSKINFKNFLATNHNLQTPKNPHEISKPNHTFYRKPIRIFNL